MHHIPNVTTVVNEIFRCLAVGGHVLMREPIVSMGDWSKPRAGLTKHERGVPIKIFRNIVTESGFTIISEKLCVFRIVPMLWKYFGRDAYNSNFATWLDAQLCKLFKWNIHYHPSRFVHKLRPTCIYFVLTKGSAKVREENAIC